MCYNVVMSALDQVRKEIKEQILIDYLSGMDIKAITAKYGFKHIRTAYHHLAPLAPEQKIQHMINKGKRLQEELDNENTADN